MIRAKDVYVVVSAYNEARHIADVVRGIRKAGFSHVIVVDDGSKDDTQRLARKAGAIALRHMVNLHKGAAMRTGAEYALSCDAKAIVFLDGDGQHDPRELRKFLVQLQHGCDVVFGGRRITRNMPIVRRLGKIFTHLAVRTLYGMKVYDVLSGYRAMTASAYRRIRWTSRDYLVESEIVALVGKSHLRYTEITISTIYHDKYKGVTVLDGVKILWHLILWRFTK